MLSVEEIKERSTTLRGALEASRDEWAWRARATEKELKDYLDPTEVDWVDRCGVCQFNGPNNCMNCVLYHGTKGRCGPEFTKASRTYNKWFEGKATISELREALWGMVARLDRELAKLEPEKKKPELRHGDYGFKNDESFIIEYPCSYGLDSLKAEFDNNGRRWWSESKAEFCSDPAPLILGNIFDDLAALKEDVHFIGFGGNGNFLLYADNGSIVLNGVWYPIKEIKQFILKLHQMVATAERRQKELLMKGQKDGN